MQKSIKRINWQLGQILLPHHLVAQEEALLAHNLMISRQQGLPFYGLGLLLWQQELFRSGIVSIEQMTLLFPNGQLLSLPGNGSIKPLDLNGEGSPHLTIYLHLLHDTIIEDELLELPGGTISLQVGAHQLLLSCQRDLSGSAAIFKLAEVEKGPDGTWILNTHYIPPLLKIFPTLFLEGFFAKISTLLETGRRHFELQLHQPLFLSSSHLETKLNLSYLSDLERFLNNLRQGISCHPYHLYDNLSHLLSFLAPPGSPPSPLYNHDQLGPIFHMLLQQLEQCLLHETRQISSAKFEKVDDLYLLEEIPPPLSRSKEIYFVVYKPDGSDGFHLRNSKMSSRLRLHHTRQFSLAGVPLHPLKTTAASHAGFGKEAEVFTITPEEEWQHCLLEGNVVFFSPSLPSAFQLFLFWK